MLSYSNELIGIAGHIASACECTGMLQITDNVSVLPASHSFEMMNMALLVPIITKRHVSDEVVH